MNRLAVAKELVAVAREILSTTTPIVKELAIAVSNIDQAIDHLEVVQGQLRSQPSNPEVWNYLRVIKREEDKLTVSAFGLDEVRKLIL